MHLRSVQAVERIELHRRKWPAQVDQLGRRRVKFSTLVVRADDEHAHVPLGSGLDTRPIQVVDKVPVQVDVLECVALDRRLDNVCRGMRREADVLRPALIDQPVDRLDTTALAE